MPTGRPGGAFVGGAALLHTDLGFSRASILAIPGSYGGGYGFLTLSPTASGRLAFNISAKLAFS